MRRLYAIDEGAAALGLFVGQKATDATALVPDLRLEEADPGADADALLVLCDWCARFSPAAAPDPPAGLFLDITGLAHLWGGEAELGQDLIVRLARSGVATAFAIAPTPGAAWALARFGPSGAIVAEGELAQSLAPLPIEALRLEAEAARQIARLGLCAIGDLAGLERPALARRFGQVVLERLDQALGRATEALVFRRPPTPWLARLALVEPITAPDDLARVAVDISRQLCGRLEERGMAARRFELGFHRLDGEIPSVRLSLAMADRDPARLARLLSPHLEKIDPGFGVEVVTLLAGEVEPRPPRALRLDGEPTSAEALAPLIDRLVGRLGEAEVWRAEPYPSFAPERATRRAPPLSAPAQATWDPERPRPLRLFSRPEPIEAVAPIPDDPPVLFRWRGLAHRVKRSEGPERLAEEWWRRPFAAAAPERIRDYYQVEDEAGARFWLFREGLYDSGPPPRWWLHGVFG